MCRVYPPKLALRLQGSAVWEFLTFRDMNERSCPLMNQALHGRGRHLAPHVWRVLKVRSGSARSGTVTGPHCHSGSGRQGGPAGPSLAAGPTPGAARRGAGISDSEPSSGRDAAPT